MKLTDLNPNWVSTGGEGISDGQGNPVPERHGMGVRFDCPCGSDHANEEWEKTCIVMFDNPLDGGENFPQGSYWHRTGETFETLTLTPSILRSSASCKWHGYITNGEIVNA